jgi:hypothetical protein
MVKKLLPFIILLLLSVTLFGQTDYSKITFNSKIYKYKDSKPRIKELGIDKEVISTIIELLGDTLYSENEKTEIINRTWLAYTDPKTFDFVYKDFAIKTNKSWGQVNAKGKMILEPNPYLTEWTINDSEFPYFQIALSKILDYYNLISYADDVSTVRDSFKDLLITEKLKFQDPDEEDWAYSYLKRVNEELAQKGLVALVTKGYYDIIVCKLKNKDKITSVFGKLKWELVIP